MKTIFGVICLLFVLNNAYAIEKKSELPLLGIEQKDSDGNIIDTAIGSTVGLIIPKNTAFFMSFSIFHIKITPNVGREINYYSDPLIYGFGMTYFINDTWSIALGYTDWLLQKTKYTTAVNIQTISSIRHLRLGVGIIPFKDVIPQIGFEIAASFQNIDNKYAGNSLAGRLFLTHKLINKFWMEASIESNITSWTYETQLADGVKVENSVGYETSQFLLGYLF